MEREDVCMVFVINLVKSVSDNNLLLCYYLYSRFEPKFLIEFIIH